MLLSGTGAIGVIGHGSRVYHPGRPGAAYCHAMQADSARPCHVCLRPAPQPDVAECASCHGVFHLATTIRSVTQDCGVILMNDVTFGLVFVCNHCETNPEGWTRVG